jgi:hypothetical protein
MRLSTEFRGASCAFALLACLGGITLPSAAEAAQAAPHARWPGALRDATASRSAHATHGPSATCIPAGEPGGSEGPGNDGGQCGFTITGRRALPEPPVPPDPNSEFAVGSSKLAAQCLPQQAARDRGDGIMAAHLFASLGAPDGSAFLLHFLGGSGTPIDRPDGSVLSRAVQQSSIFQALDKTVQKQAKHLLDAGRQNADVTAVTYNPDFSGLGASFALQAAFGGTQGLDITGRGHQQNGLYTGTITYIVRDIFGFYNNNQFLGAGAEMHYLQGVCGAPFYPQGAHWFADSVTVTVPFSQRVGTSAGR